MLSIARARPPSFFLPKYSSLANHFPRFLRRTLLSLRPSSTAVTTTNTDTLPPPPSFSALGVNPPSTSTTTRTSSPSSPSSRWPTTPFLQRAAPPPRAFGRQTKSHIPGLFAARAPQLDPTPFVAAAHVFPMRVNSFVVEELVDWSNIPKDPIFQLVFPQPGMLNCHELRRIIAAMAQPGVSKVALRALVESVRANLNPHPAGQKQENVPVMDGHPVPGMQHKYRETVLFFPTEGQFCHAFCTYCFRWAQFTAVGSNQQFESKDAFRLKEYLTRHPWVKDVLFTGGDPMVMRALTLRKYIEPLLSGVDSLDTIRIGTKSLPYWPYRYLSDPDSKAILDLFSEVSAAGKHLTIQAHFSHSRELEHPAVQEAIKIIRMTGAQIRCQGPLIRHVNDSAETWRRMWDLQTRLGAIPYYMFVERDTGARRYFSVPLEKAYQIYTTALSQVGGTTRTVRGPSMSASAGKIGVIGIEDVKGERVFVLKFFQSRNPEWTKRVFFAQFNPDATWIDELRPAFGEKAFFFENDYGVIVSRTSEGSSGQLFGLA